MTQPHRTVGDILVLTAGTPGTKGLDLTLREEGGVALGNVGVRQHVGWARSRNLRRRPKRTTSS